MFRSISDQLYGTTDRHSEVRQKIVNYMSEHDDHFKLFVEDDEPFDDYITRMHTAREWGGHQELFAASCCYNANIFVYQLQTPRWVLPAPDGVSPSDAATINLSYHGEYHYNSLRHDQNFHPEMHSAKATIIADSTSQKENEKVEKERRELLEQLQSTLPWISPTSATASLEVCDYQFLKAVEYAIETFFSVKQEQQKQEKPESDANVTVDNCSTAMTVTESKVPPHSSSSKTKSSKVKIRPGLSKKVSEFQYQSYCVSAGYGHGYQ